MIFFQGDRSIISRTQLERNTTFPSFATGLSNAQLHFEDPIKRSFSVVGDRMPSEFINNFMPVFNNGNPYLKVLHLTDIHYDPSYREGTAAVCEAPICCMKESGGCRLPQFYGKMITVLCVLETVEIQLTSIA